MPRGTYNFFMFYEAMHPEWQGLLADQKPVLESIEKGLAELAAAEGTSESYLPAPHNVMRAFATDPRQTRVLIVGQDPYPTPGHAIGLAFACPNQIKPQPRSLQNIRAELATDLGLQASAIDLAGWADQGVMLLNRTLTVSARQTNSHLKLGWQPFTAVAIERLAALRADSLVALLWGKPAQAVAGLIEPAIGSANVLTAAHPSPLSARRGFFGSKPFSGANGLLVKKGLQPIDWLG
jgi:uracil-DNA glycosylase